MKHLNERSERTWEERRSRKEEPKTVSYVISPVVPVTLKTYNLANNTLTSIQTDLRAHGETLTDVPVIAASVGRIETGITDLNKDVTEIGRDVAALKAVGKTASLSTRGH